MDAESQEIRQARQRASVKWLLSKAFNNRVPDNLKEPFYRDHENQERLKPQIIVEMGNATVYCDTLSNLYSDPNYQSLNHWSILQTLARKGVPVAESSDMPLTETVLIQTNPLRINAHMAVIESLMILYAKETTSSDRISSTIRRISGSKMQIQQDQSYEQALLSWISHACAALKKRIAVEIEAQVVDENGIRLQTPDIPPVRDFQDLCDGICLALLISYYCPKVIPWTSVRINYLPAVEDSIHNVLLVSNFSQKHLPYSVFHMTPEDITYMRGSMKLNLVVLLADLFNLFEIHPAKCVCYPGMDAQEVITKRNFGTNEHGICHRRGLVVQTVTPIPDLRSELDSSCSSPTNRPPFQVSHSVSAEVSAHSYTSPAAFQNEASHNEGFVVHKSRGITTLSSMNSSQKQQEPLVPARLRQSKEKSNIESKADERGDYVPAGRPSNWEENRRPSYAGRRSRRNSSSEDSQLTIENFGGSQDQLNTLGRFDKERERDRERKLSIASVEPAMPVRSSIADARGTLQLGYDTDSGSEKQDHETEKYLMQRQPSVDNVSLLASNAQHNNTANISRPMPSTQNQHSNITDYTEDNLSEIRVGSQDFDPNSVRQKPSNSGARVKNEPWQNNHNDPYEEDVRSLDNASKLSSIRMKLEEKRRRIEQDKRKIESALIRHQEKVKLMNVYHQNDSLSVEEGINKLQGEPIAMAGYADRSGPGNNLADKQSQSPIEHQLTQDDIESTADIFKWETLSNDSNRTSDIDPVDLDKYQQSIAIMNMNLQDIQQDIQRLASQQSQIHAQHLQAQQLIQAQQIANILQQQQTFGSQQHLTDTFQQRPMQQQQSFGSTPHLPHAFNSSVNTYNSRPPSRDPYQQMHPMPIQYINEHGQYMAAQQQQPPPPLMQQTQYMQPQNIYGDNVIPYNNHSFIGPQFIPHQSQAQPQYINRPTAYDDYSLSHQGRDINSPQPNHFYLHEVSSQPPPSSQRRTWSQPTYEHQQPVDINSWQPQKKMGLSDQGSVNWKKNSSSNVTHQQGFVLHHNDGGGEFQQLFQVHSSPQRALNDSGTGVQRQQSMTNLHDKRTTNAMPKVLSSPAPQRHSDDIMAPQSICFIGDEEDVEEIERNIIESMQTTRITADYLQQIQSGRGSSSEDYENELLKNTQKYNNITSGNLTYRIPSPSRPSLHANSFHNPHKDKTNEKGFYISFDDSQPKRPKPPLRAKRSSPKKEKYADNVDHQAVTKRESFSQLQSRREDDGFSNNINESKQQNSNNDNNTASVEINNSTYNKYTDSPPIQIRQLAPSANSNNHTLHERRHLGDVTNSQQTPQSLSPANLFNTTATVRQQNNHNAEPKAIVIGTDVTTLDPDSVEEMERRKEKIMLLSLQRRQEQEEAKARKEIETAQKREREREKEEERARKKEEQMARRAAILEQHRLKKAIEEAEREGKTLDRSDLSMKQQSHNPAPRLRQQRITRPRPKTIHVDDGSVDLSEASSISSRERKGSNTNLTGYGQLSSNSLRRDFYRGSQDSLAVKESPDEYPSTSSTPIGRRGSYKTSREPNAERGRSRISVAKGSTLNFRGRKSNSLMNLCDSGLGRATPPRRAPSPGMAVSGRHMPSPSGPGSLPPGLISKRRGFDDGSSDISSHLNSMMEYSGPKLYKQPAAKSNRGIILNAVEYCVFPGAVNREAKQKVLEKIARSEAKHFLVLFRDAGCQFRALYSYIPESDQVSKLFGTGPSQVDEVMFDKFFKYNSGGKCFSQVHTKHLTVTIDAFTIHNSLWQGKKVQLPSKKDMALVI